MKSLDCSACHNPTSSKPWRCIAGVRTALNRSTYGFIAEGLTRTISFMYSMAAPLRSVAGHVPSVTIRLETHKMAESWNQKSRGPRMSSVTMNESALRALLDKQEIAEVLARYCRAIDRLDEELL